MVMLFRCRNVQTTPQNKCTCKNQEPFNMNVAANNLRVILAQDHILEFAFCFVAVVMSTPAPGSGASSAPALGPSSAPAAAPPAPDAPQKRPAFVIPPPRIKSVHFEILFCRRYEIYVFCLLWLVQHFGVQFLSITVKVRHALKKVGPGPFFLGGKLFRKVGPFMCFDLDDHQELYVHAHSHELWHESSLFIPGWGSGRSVLGRTGQPPGR